MNREGCFTLLSALIAIYSSIPALSAAAQPLMRDEKIIFELLHHGEIVLSPDVAKAFGQDQSITQIRRIGLRNEQYQIRAAFRDKAIRRIKEVDITFSDNYYHELAAYIISDYLGLNIIPPTVMREIRISSSGLNYSKDLRQGTLQFWVENSTVLFDHMDTDLVYPGNVDHKNSQIKEIKVFDCIIGNVDRHAGNLLVDGNPRFEATDSMTKSAPYLGKIWAIDHSRAFYRGQIRSFEYCRLSKLKKGAISLQFAQSMKLWDIEKVEYLLLQGGLSAEQIESIRPASIELRFRKVQQHFIDTQRESGLSEKEFYSSGIWHRVY
ncbi:hypothetical protein [Aestuariibacter salexigens]|uniref:hypothetical protein n=1 Tax=Aestuariibacter salexigens TaxID=226010 RepID=UPI0004174E68|nr:hypothetical protein [Aestuariibacter salexigens]